VNATADAPRTHVDMDLAELMRLLWARRLLLSSIVVVFVGLAVAAGFVLTPLYRSEALLVPAEVEATGMSSLLGNLGELGGLAALAGLDFGGNANATAESLAVLRSRSFTEAFLKDLDLMPVLFEDEWDGAAKRWRDADDPPTMADGYKYFDQEIRSVQQDLRTGLVTVRIDWRDPEVSAEWTNALIDRLNAEMRRRAIERTNAAVKYLEQELAKTVIVDTRTAIGRLMESQINQRMLANVTEEYAFRVIDRALPSDDDDPVRPRRLVMAVTAAAAGLLFGVVVVLATRRGRR
jgi:uncharacterized protein involved in exopolysaccharide biosynthesis